MSQQPCEISGRFRGYAGYAAAYHIDWTGCIFVSDLQERFADHNRAVYCLSTIIPAFVNQYAFDALLPAVETENV